jgi:hypothetical protein
MSVNRSSGNARRTVLWLAAVVFVAAVLGCWKVGERRAFARRTHCVGNLVHIKMDKAASQKEMGLPDGAPIPEKTLDKSLSQLGTGLRSAYRCPEGGTYLIGNAGTLPRCTYTNVCYTWELEKNPPWLKRRAWKHSLEP